MRQVDGSQIKDQSITDAHVKNNAGIQQSKIEGLPGISGSVKALEMLKQVEEEALSYSEFTYSVEGKLTMVQVWRDGSKAELLFTKSYGYTADKLTSLVITRNSDGYSITTTFTYSSGRLASKLTVET